MKLNKTYVFILCLMLSCVVIFNVIIDKDKDVEIESCNSNLRIIDAKNILDLHIYASLSEGKGVLALLVQNTSDNKSYFRLRKLFSYKKMRDGFILFYNEDSIVNVNRDDNINIIKNYIPSFFLNNNSGDKLILKIIEINKGSWVFMGADTPYFICEDG